MELKHRALKFAIATKPPALKPRLLVRSWRLPLGSSSGRRRSWNWPGVVVVAVIIGGGSVEGEEIRGGGGGVGVWERESGERNLVAEDGIGFEVIG